MTYKTLFEGKKREREDRERGGGTDAKGRRRKEEASRGSPSSPGIYSRWQQSTGAFHEMRPTV